MPKSTCLTLSLFITSIIFSTEVDLSRVQSSVPILKLLCGNHGFKVQDSEGIKSVERGDTDEALRHVNRKNMALYLARNGVRVTKAGDKYVLRSYVPGLGGGPVCGWAAYYTVKVLCWAGIGVATSVVVTAATESGAGKVGLPPTATAGLSGTTSTAADFALGSVTAEATKDVIMIGSTGIPVVTTATVLGGSVINMGTCGTEAGKAIEKSTVEATGIGMVASAGMAGGIEGAIESLANGARWFFETITWLP